VSNGTTIVIFGASGDLTNRKLVPALLNLYCKGRLPEAARIVGFARRPWDNGQFREVLLESAREYMGDAFESERWAAFAEKLFYVSGSINELDDFKKLDRHLIALEGGPANRLYYLSVGPALYEPAIRALADSDMARERDGWRRVVIEKPFGVNLASAHALNEIVHRTFDESQVYRIDHYLGKETAQNGIAVTWTMCRFR
jgi:glucose-6-phosphate 1-dehydrogenase